MEWLHQAVDFFLHLDRHLDSAIRDYGAWTYLLLFGIVFLETGIVVTPFLPGDSLLFAAGSIAALGSLDVVVLFLLLSLAAALGDTVNYWIGHAVGPKIFDRNTRFLKREHLERTHRFYEKHGGKTIFLARFIPIIRTFAPFVAGIGRMSYGKFLVWNVVGAVAWNGFFVFLGYFFGQLPWVKQNFGLVILAIIVISVMPVAVELLRRRRGPSS
ncbi:MAG: DedA family protein [Planctomycetes bacterium]|nr:DedA family protein [Planctomycetota bacterium]MBI3844534.1 DedA family protein [Planctomycetota bacterium]